MRPPIADQASKSGSVQISMRDGEDSRSVQKSQRSVENGDVEEAFEFLGDGEAKKEEGNPVVGGNVVDDEDPGSEECCCCERSDKRFRFDK